MGNGNCNVLDEIIVRGYLNALISATRQRKLLDQFDSRIKLVSTPDYIQMYTGIEILAEVLGAELFEEERDDEYYKYCFLYKDVEFLQLSKERLGKYAGTD